MALQALRPHGRLALWLAAALLLAEAGRQGWPLLAGGLLPLAAAVLLAGWALPRQLPRCLLLPHPTTWWTDPTRLACAVAMLPMLAVLPRLADWCSGTLNPATMLALHAAAMLLPGALLRPVRRKTLTLLLVAGAAVPLLWPGFAALMAGQCLQAAAWSLAAARHPGAGRTSGTPTRGVATLTALLLVTAGLGLDRYGPAALVATQLLAATLAVLGLCAPGRQAARPATAEPAPPARQSPRAAPATPLHPSAASAPARHGGPALTTPAHRPPH